MKVCFKCLAINKEELDKCNKCYTALGDISSVSFVKQAKMLIILRISCIFLGLITIISLFIFWGNTPRYATRYVDVKVENFAKYEPKGDKDQFVEALVVELVGSFDFSTSFTTTTGTGQFKDESTTPGLLETYYMFIDDNNELGIFQLPTFRSDFEDLDNHIAQLNGITRYDDNGVIIYPDPVIIRGKTSVMAIETRLKFWGSEENVADNEDLLNTIRGINSISIGNESIRDEYIELASGNPEVFPITRGIFFSILILCVIFMVFLMTYTSNMRSIATKEFEEHQNKT